MNSNVPRNSNLASQLHRNYLFKFELVLSSVRSNTQMMASRCANRLQTCSVSTPAANMVSEIVRLQSALNDDYSNVSGKIKHVPYFRANNKKIFSKTCATLFTFEQFSLIHSALQ